MSRVLIVEPDPLIAEFIEKGLREAGVETLTVDMLPARDRLAEFDLVLIDDRVVADPAGGLTTRLADELSVPLVVLTGNGRTADTMAALGDTQADVISKPFRFSDLLSLIERRLAE